MLLDANARGAVMSQPQIVAQINYPTFNVLCGFPVVGNHHPPATPWATTFQLLRGARPSVEHEPPTSVTNSVRTNCTSVSPDGTADTTAPPGRGSGL